METKQTLANLIEAYADAKRSGNETLVRYAAAPIQEFLLSHDVIPVSRVSEDSE